MERLAPIVLFVYNRPVHLRQTLEALACNELADASDLFIYADGPKVNATAEQLERIKEVRALIRERKWCKHVYIRESDTNRGLAASVVRGVTEVINERGKAIMIEDDVLTSPYFLRFMNQALTVYEHEKKVLSISSWNYYTDINIVKDNFFFHLPDTIAWATWQRSWKLFENDASKLHERLKKEKKLKKFNMGNYYNFEKMLLLQINKQVSSWGIRWTAVAVLNDTLSFYPKVSLTKHIGFGMDSTHCMEDDYNAHLKLADSPVEVKAIPVKESKPAFDAWLSFEKNVKKSPEVIDKSIVPVKKLFFILQVLKAKFGWKPIKKTLVNGIVLPLINASRGNKKPYFGWYGNFRSWQEASKHATGYDAANILEKVKTSILKVKSGEAVYERDSVIFDEVQYTPELLEAFRNIAAENGGALEVTDFGGSLGSSYFQHKALLNGTVDLKWSIVEQSHFVESGKNDIEDDRLRFFNTIQQAAEHTRPQVLLLSGVIQYFEAPYTLIDELLAAGFTYILVDRTAFIEGEKERITVQIVPEEIYKASYPAWFLNEQKFIKAFASRYDLLESFDNNQDLRELLGDKWTYRKGFVFKRRL